MKLPGALFAIAAAVAILCAGASDAVAASTPSAPLLLARVLQPRDELALLGRPSAPSGPSRKERASELKFTNRDGYQITVVAFGQTVALSVSNGSEGLAGGEGPAAPTARRFSTTTYLSHGKVSPNSIQASFADRGRIELRFRPSGRVLHASRHAGCRRHSRNVIARFGLFVGELRFRGEGGYTSAQIHRVHGGSIDLAALVACRPGPRLPGLDGLSAPPPSPEPSARGSAPRRRGADSPSPAVATHPSRRPKRTTLLASLKLPLSRTVFGARRSGAGTALFLAAEEGVEGRVGIVRLATVSAPESAFTFEDSLAGAAVAPPIPFSGKGVFQQGIGRAESWAGSLAVSFLGAPRTPLTGPPFRARLTQSW